MSVMRRGWGGWAILLAMLLVSRLGVAQVATTTVQDTVYTASGTPASGTVVISWGSFTTAGGEAIPAGTTSVTIGAGGALSVALAPNAGGNPMGSYYTAVFHLSDGTTSKQYWVVPVTVPGGGPAKLAAIENSVLPTSVAMQTVSKQYVDDAIAQAQIGAVPLDASPYVLKAGDTMTGPLVLPADPVSPLQAADKNYVDESVAQVSGGLGQTVHTLPTATQTVSQPTGTELGVNNLNGELYASQYQTGSGGNGIANAVNSSDCANGCKVVVEPSYSTNDPLTLGAQANGTVLEDQRGGADDLVAVNPLAVNSSFSAPKSVTEISTLTQQQLDTMRPGSQAIGVAAEQLQTVAETGGLNLFPGEIENPPSFKSTYSVLGLTGVYNTQGQHIQLNSDIYCYGVGDCLAGGQFITSSGGYRDNSDEGTHPWDLQVSEDNRVFSGSCATGCATGSTTLSVTPTTGGGTQGDGRFLMDTAAAKTISAGSIVSGGKTIFGTAKFSGTSFPVSVFLQTAATLTSQASNVAPGTVTVPIATSAVLAGFATNTAALPASAGVACVADIETTSQFPNYEMAPYTTVDATHLSLTLNKPHRIGAVIAVGGLCGYGLDQTVDDVGAIKQIFPVIGSTDGTDLYYADALTPSIGGATGAAATSGFLNATVNIASISRSGNVVTVTSTSNIPDVNGLTMTVSGVADSSYNGTFAVTTTGAFTLTYVDDGPNSTSSGGTISVLTGGYALYPMAEVLSVYDTTTKAVDGAFTLAPNTVAWATGDQVQEPHYYQQNTAADMEIVTQYVPRPVQYVQAGKDYAGNVTAGLRGWQVMNSQPDSYYLGNGGTHNLPDDAYVVSGPWRNDFELDAGTQALLYVHCNLHGCNRWDSPYDLFELDSALGTDFEQYQPQNSTVSWVLQGNYYSFSPTAFSAPTIDVGTLNATTINGGVSGSSITSGTLSAARLPVFGPSGTTHAAGIVPDPGSTAGATRYLREDGTWDVPAGGSGGSTNGTAGGDLSGSYPNPAVTAVHATNGTMDGVTIGATTPVSGTFTTLVSENPTAATSGAPDPGSGTSSLSGSIYRSGAQYPFSISQQVLSGPGMTGAGNFNLDTTFSSTAPNATYSAVNQILNAPNASICANNSNDNLGGLFGETYSTVYFGSCTSSGLQAYYYAIVPSSGKQGSIVPLSTASAPSFRNVLDDGSGNSIVQGQFSSNSYMGPAMAPTGSCPTSGAWVFSQDGHATFCASGTWVTKI